MSCNLVSGLLKSEYLGHQVEASLYYLLFDCLPNFAVLKQGFQVQHYFFGEEDGLTLGFNGHVNEYGELSAYLVSPVKLFLSDFLLEISDDLGQHALSITRKTLPQTFFDAKIPYEVVD